MQFVKIHFCLLKIIFNAFQTKNILKNNYNNTFKQVNTQLKWLKHA